MKKNILLILSLLFITCDKNEDISYNDKKIITTIIDNFIKPEQSKFYDDAKTLQNLTKKFVGNVNSENLEKLRKQWFILAKDWSRCYAFNIGDVEKKRFFIYLAKFPVTTSSLEDKIENKEQQEIDKKYVLNMGDDNKGIFGLEYLLFEDYIDKTIVAFSNSENRRKVLKFIVDEIVNDVNDQKNVWDKYAPKLIENKEKSGSIDNSINLIFNGLNNVIHFAWETKIEKGIRKKELEAPYSKKSLDLIKENVKITKEVYFNGGFADKVNFVTKNNNLNNTIKVQYSKIEKLISEMNSPLSEADTKKAKDLQEALKRLESLFTADVMSTLSLIATGTDGDGD